MYSSILHHLYIASLSSDSCQSVLCIYESVSVLFVSLYCSLDPTYQWFIWYLPFSDWLMSLSIILPRSSHAVAKGKISFFFYFYNIESRNCKVEIHSWVYTDRSEPSLLWFPQMPSLHCLLIFFPRKIPQDNADLSLCF